MSQFAQGKQSFCLFLILGIIINSAPFPSQKCLIWTISYLVTGNIRNKLPIFPKDKLNTLWVPRESLDLDLGLGTSGCLVWPVVDNIPVYGHPWKLRQELWRQVQQSKFKYLTDPTVNALCLVYRLEARARQVCKT